MTPRELVDQINHKAIEEGPAPATPPTRPPTFQAAAPAPRMPIVTLPRPMTLADLTRYCVARTGTHSHRVTGNPDMLVRKVAIGVGYAFPGMPTVPDVDAIVGGESAEGSASALPTMDQSAFAADMTNIGRPRGIIFLGHM